MTSSVITRLVQMEVSPGRPQVNTRLMLDHVARARTEGVQLVIFPEMAIPGYLLGDEWERPAFLRECEACGEQVRAAAHDITVVFGNVAIDTARRNEDGRVRKYNALFLAENGAFLGPTGSPYPFAIKTLQPNYREFDDSRHFYDLPKLAREEGRTAESLLQPIPSRLAPIGGSICEDAWDEDYHISPLKILKENGAQLIVNISCSPYTRDKNRKRNRVFSRHARELGVSLAYINNVGIQNNGKTVFTFDGASCVYDSHGNQVVCGEPFEETTLTVDIPMGQHPQAFGKPIDLEPEGMGHLHKAIDHGTRRFMKLCGVTRVTIGISGGIDSAVVAALYRGILPPDDLMLVNMPGPFTSGTTRALAIDLAQRLGCRFTEVPIAPALDLTLRQLEVAFPGAAAPDSANPVRVTQLVRENIQARDRSSRILAALASAFGSVFTCNANKTEMTVGYTTLYGDLGGYLANIADLWKMEVYALGRHLNDVVYGREVIPAGIFTVKPSAELSADQNVDENKGDPLIYPYHDRLFASWVEAWNRLTPEDILEAYQQGRLEERIGYDGKVAELFATPDDFIRDLERWWNQYQGMGIAKRIQAPPVLAVKRRAFGFDHRESQLGPRYTARYEAIKVALLDR